MVIDFRSRPPYKSFATGTALFPRKVDQDFKNLRDIPPLNKNSGKMESARKCSMELYFEEAEEAGIDLSVIYGRKTKTEGYVPNEEIAELLETYPTRFIGFGGLDLSDIGGSVRELEQCKKWGFKGISLEPGYEIPAMYFDDERLTPIYEACKSLNMIVSLTSSIFVGPDLSYCDPVHIQHVANRFPNLKLVVDHGCWPYVNGIIGAAFICPNIYLCPDFYGYIPNMPFADEFVRAANCFLEYRMMYGSGYPIRSMIQSLEQFKTLQFRPEILDRLLYDNAKELLGIS